MELEKVVFKQGNSLGIIIGKIPASIAGIKEGDKLILKVSKNKLIFTKVEKKGENK